MQPRNFIQFSLLLFLYAPFQARISELTDTRASATRRAALCRVRAKITDERGTVVPNAIVRATPRSTTDGFESVDAASGADGIVILNIPRLWERADLSVSEDNTLRAAQVSNIELNLAAVEIGIVRLAVAKADEAGASNAPENTNVNEVPFDDGRVVDTAGEPIEGSTVAFTNSYNSKPVITDADGRFVYQGLTGPPRGWNVNITKFGYVPQAIEGKIPANHTFRMARGMIIKLRAPEGKTIHQFQYTVQVKAGAGWRQTSGEIDRADARPINNELWDVTISNGDFLRGTVHFASGETSTITDVDLNKPPLEIILKLKSRAETAITLYDSESKPAADLLVSIYFSNRYDLRKEFVISERSAPNGNITYSAATGERVSIESDDPRFVIEDTFDRPQSRDRLNPVESRPPNRYIIHSARAASGKLTFGGKPPGEPIPIAAYRIDRAGVDATIRLAEMVVIDGNGQFTFRQLYPGRYAIVPKRLAPAKAVRDFSSEWPDFRNLPWKHGVLIDKNDAKETICNIALPFAQERFVEGTVFKNDEPALGVLVTLTKNGGGVRGENAMTDANGRYRLPVSIAGDYSLEVLASESYEKRKIKIEDSQSRQIHFDLYPTAAEGHVTDTDGKPARVHVAIQRALDKMTDFMWQSPPVEVFTDVNGHYKISIPRGGMYRLLYYDPRHRFASHAGEPFIVTRGESPAVPTVILSKAGPVRIRAGSVAGSPGTGRIWIMSEDKNVVLPALAQSWLFPGVDGKNDGIVVQGLPPGKYRMRLLPFDDEIINIPPGSGLVDVHFTKLQPGAETRPATGESAYHSREANEQEKWDWGGETPFLYETQDWAEYVLGKL